MSVLSPVVFAGPSGVGKGTIVNKLMQEYPRLFGFSVSHTTRGPRPGEENGVHYHFTTKEEFERAIANDEFIEYAPVHTNYYGTSKAAVERVIKEGKVCFLDIDIQGVKNVKKSSLSCKYVFINPPSVETLEQRLRDRGTETEDKIQVRMNNSRDEIAFGSTPGNFDVVIVNDGLDEAVNEVKGHLMAWFPSLDW